MYCSHSVDQRPALQARQTAKRRASTQSRSRGQILIRQQGTAEIPDYRHSPLLRAFREDAMPLRRQEKLCSCGVSCPIPGSARPMPTCEPGQLQVMSAIEQCRSAALGGHVKRQDAAAEVPGRAEHGGWRRGAVNSPVPRLRYARPELARLDG